MNEEQLQVKVQIFYFMKQGRKNTINLLKAKITALQTELTTLQKQPEKHLKSLSPYRFQNSSRSPKNVDYKSPTFWTKNPITHDDKYSPKKTQIPLIHRNTYKNQIKRSVSPSIKNISYTIDRAFYQSQSTIQLISTSPDRKVFKQNNNFLTGKRFQFSHFGQERRFDSSKQSKKRTFERSSNNIILYPERQKVSRRKITPPNKSPDKILTEHPLSNNRLYAFPHKNIIISKKGLIKDKNASMLCLSSSLGELVPIKFDQNKDVRRKKSQKKHLNQYYRDNFNSQLQLE